ncbi:DUF6187 family protein [Amycolatopsis decaplanina]|uniref:Uncharacterized protein n=1 Tax=Amycolatopsis decaplanina DSM 44594 TaxID=1284240 RepID=M2YT50_9PSEU|nr:DUF6187 family protein [Amycolatopsis decaplanina]EME51943.1 hypothetical protein H074_34328 [Amycolatopsis decaplanina DSM 44594]
MSEPYDSRFTLPSIDDAPSTESGVILMGLDAERLLAGVGLARLADEPALVALAVDQARHDALDLGTDALIEAGILRWRAVRPLIEAGPEMTAVGSLRREWEHATARVAATVTGLGPASVACLAACWLRRDDIDDMAEFAEHGRAPKNGSDTQDVLSRVFAD